MSTFSAIDLIPANPESTTLLTTGTVSTTALYKLEYNVDAQTVEYMMVSMLSLEVTGATTIRLTLFDEDGITTEVLTVSLIISC